MFVRRIGYWRGGYSGGAGLPDPRDFVDPGWDPEERADVLDHLRSHPATWWYMGYSPCRLCDKDNGTGEFTDGTFAWPQGLAHYVEDHDVRLPEWFVTHVRASMIEREQAVVDDDWWREAAYRREPDVAPTQLFRLVRIDCGDEESTHLVYAADDGQRVLVGWGAGESGEGQAAIVFGNAAPNALGFGAGVPTGPNDRLVADAEQYRRHVSAAVSVAKAEPVQALSPAVIHTDRMADAALQRAAEQLHVTLGQPTSRLDRSPLQRHLATIEARGPFDPVEQRDLVQLLLAVGEHLGVEAEDLWTRLVRHVQDQAAPRQG